MLKIKSTQLRVFSDALRADFVDRMRHHLPNFFPQKCREMGDSGLRAFIEDGIDRAALYRIDTDYGVCLYLYVMMRFGSRFDEDASFEIIRKSLIRLDRSAVRNIESVFDFLFNDQTIADKKD
jgi:hypothetical protein